MNRKNIVIHLGTTITHTLKDTSLVQTATEI